MTDNRQKAKASQIKTNQIKRRSLSVRSVFVALGLFVFAASSLFLSRASSSRFDLSTVSVPGVSGESNNVAFAYGGQYAILAAFAPSTEPPGDAAVLDESFNNHWIYGVNAQNPAAGLTKADLHLYYPTIVKFDAETDRVYARGTSYEKDSDGYWQPVDRITYLNINKSLEFDGDGVSFEIPGIDTRFSSGAPSDFALGRSGKYLVFTNGASIFTFNVSVGYTYRVDIVPPSQFSENYAVTKLGYDQANELLTVVVSGRKFKKGNWQYFSDLYCYRLVENGTLDLVKQVPRDSFPESVDGGTTAVTPDSNIEISPDGAQAFFVIDDGSICSFRLDDSGLDGAVTRLANFHELAVLDDQNRGPRLVNYDAATNSIGVVKPGASLFIKRPIYGKPGGGNGIKRPIYGRFQESPALVLAQLNKRNRISAGAAFTEFGGRIELGISNVASAAFGQGFIATGSGNLFSIDFRARTLNLLGSMGSRTDSLTYNAEGGNVVGINSFVLDDAGAVVSPGAVAIAKMSDDGGSVASLTAAVLSPFSLGGHSTVGIRRPCALGRQ